MKKLTLAILLLLPMIAEGAYTQNEVVAITILAEARGEGETGMYAVACVIAQRALERKKTPKAICLQKWQFSCWNANDPQRNRLGRLLKTPQAAYALRLAKHITEIDRSFTGNANHYHTKSVKPYWSKGKKPVKVLGNHLFFRL